MRDQGTLFVDPPRPPWQGGPPLRPPEEPRPAPAHRDGPDTEHEAARLIEPRAATWRAVVLEALLGAGDRGMTDWELHTALGGNLYTVAPRRNELVRDGWLCDSGRRRETNNGRRAVVWIPTERARRPA